MLDLPAQPLSDTEDPNIKSIAGWKMRAGGQLVTDELALVDGNEVSSARIYNAILESTCRVAHLFPDNPVIQNRAFLSVDGLFGESTEIYVGPLRRTAIQTTFQEICRGDPVLRAAKICASQIRTSVLTLYRKRTGSLDAAQRKAGHASGATTQRYTDRPLFHIAHDESVRRFQILLQALVLEGVSPGSQEGDLIEEALQEGLGVLLPDTKQAHDPTLPSSWLPAITASDRPLRVAVSPRLLADLIDFNRHLLASRDEALATRPEKWLADWLPWQLLTDEVIKRSRVGRFARVFRDAVDLNKKLGPRSWPPL